MRLSNHQILTNTYHRRQLRQVSPDQAQYLEQALDELARLLSGAATWELSGGLAIAATIGRFYRMHDDIDINVDIEDLNEFVAHARKQGYALFGRGLIVRTSLNTKIDVYKALSTTEAATGKHRHLRLARVDPDGLIVPHRQLTDYIDLYPYTIEKNEIVDLLTNQRAPLSHRYASSYTTLSGNVVRNVDLRLVARGKRMRFWPADMLDRKLIREYLQHHAENGNSGAQQATPTR